MIFSSPPWAMIILAITILIQPLKSFDFPSDVELCHRTDGDCIVKRANKIIRDHPHGYPEIFLTDFEPFRLDKLEITGSPDSPVNFNLQMTDLIMHGYSNMTFTKFSGFTKDPKKIRIETESINKRVVVRGKYKISGRILVLPITGEGDINVVITGLKIKTRTKPTFTVRNGKTFLKTSNYKLHVDADNMKIRMTNLFNGDRTLGESMINVINDNWKLLWDEMSPRFNEAIAAENEKMFDNMYSNIPYEEMFLPD